MGEQSSFMKVLTKVIAPGGLLAYAIILKAKPIVIAIFAINFALMVVGWIVLDLLPVLSERKAERRRQKMREEARRTGSVTLHGFGVNGTITRSDKSKSNFK